MKYKFRDSSELKAGEIERFWSLVDKNGPIPEHRPELGPCWLWKLKLSKYGYGYLFIRRNGKSVGLRAHRVSRILIKGAIPDDLVPDHLCRVRHCVNPDHSELVTEQVNILRGTSFSAMQAKQTHCLKGHPLSGDNLRTHRGLRVCKTCERNRCRSFRQKSRHAKAEKAGML